MQCFKIGDDFGGVGGGIDPAVLTDNVASRTHKERIALGAEKRFAKVDIPAEAFTVMLIRD